MKTFCNLTDWKTQTIIKGIGAGSDNVTKYVVAADNWNWSIAIVVKYDKGERIPRGIKYYMGFCHLLNDLKELEIDINNAVMNILGELEKRTGKKFNQNFPNKNESLEQFGKKIDNFYKCNFANKDHNFSGYKEKNVYYRLFQEESND